MILPDVNLLVYTYNADAPENRAARQWWEGLVNGDEPVYLAWFTVLGFIRVITHPRIVPSPMRPVEATAIVREWLEQPCVQIVEPGPKHLDLVDSLLAHLGIAGDLTTDAHLAALAIEYQCELHSNDADFSRFPGLRWRNPLAKAPGRRKPRR